jgi:hypothetical protein
MPTGFELSAIERTSLLALHENLDNFKEVGELSRLFRNNSSLYA